MAQARQCDRCKKFYKVSDKDKCIISCYRMNNHEIRRRDLCEDCYNELNKFLDCAKQEVTE